MANVIFTGMTKKASIRTQTKKTFIKRYYLYLIASCGMLFTLKVSLILNGIYPLPAHLFLLRLSLYFLFFVSILFLLFRWQKRWPLVVFYLCSFLFYFLLLAYFSYYGRLLNILEALPHLKAGLETVKGGVLDFIPLMGLLFIDLPFFIVLLLFYNNENFLSIRTAVFRRPLFTVLAACIFLSVCLFPPMIYSCIGFEKKSKGGGNLQFSVAGGGVWFYSFYTVRRRRFLRDREKSEDPLILEDQTLEIVSDIDDLPEKPNFLFIQIESLQSGMIEFEHNGEYLMPYLNKLSYSAIYYPYCFAYHGSNGTTDSEISIFNNIDPTKDDSFENSENTYPKSFIKDIKKAGWAPYAFHNFRADFFNRVEAYPKLGFIKLHDFYSMGFPEPIGWWPEDRLLFRFILDDFVAPPEPFLYYTITVTTHKNFRHINRFYSNSHFDDISPRVDRDGQLCFNYCDKQVEMFLSEFLEKYPHTYVFIYGDHSVNGIPFEGKLPQVLLHYQGRSVEVVPLFIITPDGKQGRHFDTLASFHDIAPTVFSLIPNDATLSSVVYGGSLFSSDLHRKSIPLQGDSFKRDDLLSVIKDFMREKNAFNMEE